MFGGTEVQVKAVHYTTGEETTATFRLPDQIRTATKASKFERLAVRAQKEYKIHVVLQLSVEMLNNQGL